MLSVKAAVIILNIHLCTTGGQYIPRFNFDAIYDFVLDVKNSSDSLFEYVAKIQAVFCPDQPICLQDGSKDRNAILKTLPPELTIGTKIIYLREIPDFIGLCCFPCSCFDHCQESNNCCLTKQRAANNTNNILNENVTSGVLAANNMSDISSMNDISDISSVKDLISTTATKTTTDKISSVSRPTVDTVQNECIIASPNAYRRIPSDPRYPAYFMINRCFINRLNDTLVRKCQNPSVYSLDETVPVTSLKTNRSYWNKHCAACNRDGDSVIHWESTAVFERGFFLFSNLLLKKFPETFDELHNYVVSNGDINYTPPFSMEDKLCIPRDLLSSCRNHNENTHYKHSMSIDCKEFYSPVSINLFGLVFSYTNIFCFFCDNSEISPMNADCKWETNQKYSSGTVMGLINYKLDSGLDDTVNDDEALQHEIGECGCNEIHDPVLGNCRPIYCPPGDVMVECRCIQLLSNLSSMPVRVFLEIAPLSGPLETLTNDKILKLRKALTAFLQNTAENSVAEMVATLKIHSEEGNCLLSVYIISSKKGCDTKQSLKTLVRYLLMNNKQELKIDKTKFYVRLTANYSLWDKYRLEVNDPTKTNQSNAIMVYPVNNRIKGGDLFIQIYSQILSPLLYCKQVQLNDTEYTEKDGLVSVNTTAGTIILHHFYQVSSTQVRVCVYDFLNAQKSGSWDPNYGPLSLNVFLIVYHGTVY